MTTITVDQKYADVLGVFGNVQDAFDLAIQRYTIEQITGKIANLRHKAAEYERKYHCDYTSFVQRMTTDENFIAEIESETDTMWEMDLLEWEFSHKGIDDWTRKLQSILLG
ncbi:MAG TPA: hypothetical protein PL105_18315 [Caldilineaceae bacterium]|nr:hypothetical protein [Caldilineaceae bacterium]